MARQANQTEVNEALPTLAMAMLSKGDETTAEYVKELFGDLLKERREKKGREEQRRLNAIKMTQEESRYKSMDKARCSHRNGRGETRLRGQKLSNGQLCLVCTFCSDEFHRPPEKDQKDIPQALMPSLDVIGG